MLAPVLAAFLLAAAAPSESPPVAGPATGATAPAPAQPDPSRKGDAAAKSDASVKGEAPAKAATPEGAEMIVVTPSGTENAAAPAAEEAGGTAAPAAQEGPRTLWLIQPLYPGQELLVGRTRDAIAALLPKENRSREILGAEELSSKTVDPTAALTCIFGDEACDDPIGALVSGVGVDRVVLIKVGQEGTGYRFRVASFEPGVVASSTAETANADLEKALLGALVKVAPLAARVKIDSDPAGATVLVDGEKVGVTPLSAQVLPGERTFRVELPLHEAFELKKSIPVRGQAKIFAKLPKRPGRLQVVSAGATIRVDGEVAGKDQVDVAMAAGSHRIELARDGYEPYAATVVVEPEKTARLEHGLEPTTWESILQALSRQQEGIYSKDRYLTFVYDDIHLTGSDFSAHSTGSLSETLEGIARPGPSGTHVQSIGVEYGATWRNIGLLWIGGSYFRSADSWTYDLAKSDDGNLFDGRVQGLTLRLLQPQLRIAFWRFVLGVRGGFLGRVGWVNSSGADDDAFVFGDLGAEAQGSVRLHILPSLYLEGAFARSWTITGSTDGTRAFRGGIGFAF